MTIPLKARFRTRANGRTVTEVVAVPAPGHEVWLGESNEPGERAAIREVMHTADAKIAMGRLVREYESRAA